MEQALTQRKAFNTKIEALRGLGALLVIIDHWAHLLPDPPSQFIIKLNPSLFGIAIFFLISGYYITDLILRMKESGDKNWLKKYLVQRFFRLLPVYYAALILFSFLLSKLRDVWEIHAFFLGNFYPFMTGKGIAIGDHLWSVGSELHFYIMWPFLLLSVPEKYYKHLAVCIFLTGPLSRYLIMWWAQGGHHSLGVFTPVIFDWIGLGALMAFWSREGLFKAKPYVLKIFEVLSPLGALIFIYCFINYKRAVFFTTIEYVLTGFFFAVYILRAALNINGVREKIYCQRPLIWLGTVSYSFYILHPFIPPAVRQYVAEPLHIGNENIFLGICLAVLIALTLVSYYFIELPVRNWSRKLF